MKRYIKQLLIFALIALPGLLPAAGLAAERLAPGEFRVKGVLISPNARSVLINNTVAKVGDRVGGAEILAIEDGEVLILMGTQRLVVQVGSTAAHGSAAGIMLAKTSLAAKARQHLVRSGDTLSEIAERYAGDGVRLNQVMAALYEANPQAFDGNINRLRAGAVLAVPERAELLGRTQYAATAVVLRHQAEWRPASEPAVAERIESREYGPVERGETLSGIALQVKDDSVSMHRMMTAIYDANPEAFGDSMDFLREGATLEIPEVGGEYGGLIAAVAGRP